MQLFHAKLGGLQQRHGFWAFDTAIELQKATIIRAGPAGLTSAHELLKSANIESIGPEKRFYMGRASGTVTTKAAAPTPANTVLSRRAIG